MTYSEKLKDPRWQKKRLEIFQRDEFMCRNCGETDMTLHVDHKVYHKGFDPWEYENYELQTLCEDCHKDVTFYRARLAEMIGYMNTFELEQLERFIPNAPAASVLIVEDLSMTKIESEEWGRIVNLVTEKVDENVGYELLDEIGPGFGDNS